jgi:hypothetical protein
VLGALNYSQFTCQIPFALMNIVYILTTCGQRCYLLKTPRGQGISGCHINTVSQSLIISRLAYALPAWGGFLKQRQINKVDSFLARAFLFGYTLKQTTLSNILCEADNKLYSSIQNANHCIHNLLSAEKKLLMKLRNAHCFELPRCRYNMFRNSFINRLVFNDAY